LDVPKTLATTKNRVYSGQDDLTSNYIPHITESQFEINLTLSIFQGECGMMFYYHVILMFARVHMIYSCGKQFDS